jgi:hypothetical protein
MSEQHDLTRDDENHPAAPTQSDMDSEQRAGADEEPEESVADAIDRFMREGPFIPHVSIAGGRMLRRVVGPVIVDRGDDRRRGSPSPPAPR